MRCWSDGRGDHQERAPQRRARRLQRALEHISTFFDEAHDPYLRERKDDVADVVGRLTINLREAVISPHLFRDLEGPPVSSRRTDVTPLLIAQLDWQRPAAPATDAGSYQPHRYSLRATACALRPWTTPASSSPRLSRRRRRHDRRGHHRSRSRNARPDRRAPKPARQAHEQRPTRTRDLPAITKTASRLGSKPISKRPTTRRASQRGAVGIGLFRSEFLLLRRTSGARRGHQDPRGSPPGRAPARCGATTPVPFDVSQLQLRIEHAAIEGTRLPLGMRGVRVSPGHRPNFPGAAARPAARRGSLPAGGTFRSSPASRSSALPARRSPRRRRRCAPGVEASRDVLIGVMIELPRRR